MHHSYLSPHLDDAVLCCGASIAQQASTGDEVQVWNIFAGSPECAGLSDYAQGLHAAAGDPVDLVATRLAEDEVACARLGAAAVYWDYPDAPYRVDQGDGAFLYNSDEQLMGWHVHPADGGLIDELVSAVWRRLDGGPGTQLHAPLGVGGHVDHLLVRAAALKLEQRGCGVLFYEDFPYAEDGHMLVRALTMPEPPGWSADVRLLPESCVAAKCEAIACYQSQIAILFGDLEGMNRRVRSYMRLVGGAEGHGERFWKSCPLPPS
ncbi:MAG TPA: PIG-L family deacetylase [Anaerolineae bacterium]|nr:PIG-L family deacetylase [Anaerolineae bacterium]